MTEILDRFKNYNFVHYSDRSEKIFKLYENMYDEYIKLGFIHVSNESEIDGAIILENGEEIIGGIFYSVTRSPGNLFIMLAFVNENFRNNGIYKKFHTLITEIALKKNKKYILSLIDLSNKLMLDTVSKSVGYKPAMQLFLRKTNQYVS
jgi:hypothetical protein